MTNKTKKTYWTLFENGELYHSPDWMGAGSLPLLYRSRKDALNDVGPLSRIQKLARVKFVRVK